MRHYSKGAKRRARKSSGLPELAPTPRKKKRGGNRQREIERDMQMPALERRARQMGAKDVDAMRSQTAGDGAGMALLLLCDPDTANRLHQHYTAILAAEEWYLRSIGVSAYPKCQRIDTAPERFEARADHTPDVTMTEDERDMAARRAWQYWRDVLDVLSIPDRAAIEAARFGWAELVMDGAVTPAGRRFVEGMKKVGELAK